LALFENPLLDDPAFEDLSDNYQPPKFCELPALLRDLFTYDGRVMVSGMRFEFAVQDNADFSHMLSRHV
jgi:hypothetical protein